MRENRDQNNSEYGQFLSSVSLYEIHVYFWGNLLPMKFLTLAHYIIICHRDVRSEVKRKKKYIYIYIYFFSGKYGGGGWGMVEHKYFFATWACFCQDKILFADMKHFFMQNQLVFFVSDCFLRNMKLFFRNKILFMQHQIFVSISRGGSRAAATSKMECFVIIVNGSKLLTIITKHSILDVAEALDPPLISLWDIFIAT